MATGSFSRRVAALFLPALFCELVESERDPRGLPIAVGLVEKETKNAEEATLITRLHAVNDSARRFGVRAGQSVVEARSLVAGLVVRSLTETTLRNALGRVAEVALAFGPTASIQSGDAFPSLDTVWLDLTAAAHLHGGEEAALCELASRVRKLGHRVRGAIADGPRLARAAAAFATSAETIVPTGRGKEMMEHLSLEALPLPRDRIVWLNRLGLLSVGDLTRLPHQSLVGRLGEHWRETLELALGRDDTPLVVYEPPRSPKEETEWEEPVGSIEPLLFALSGLTSRLSARLEGRGEAAQAIELFSPFDRSIAKLRNVALDPVPGLFFRIDLPTPLSHKTELFRVLKSKLERAELAAPVLGLSITAALLTEAPKRQLSLGGDPSIDSDPRSMAVLLAELGSEVGSDNVGVLALRGVHKPEARTQLVAIDDVSSPTKSPKIDAAASDGEFPIRVLACPVPLEPIVGQRFTVSIDNQLFTIRKTGHMMRLDQIEWWTSSPVCRDYARVWLSSGRKNVEGWIFTDRQTGRTYLQGYFD
jgi:protein ImuB